MPTFTVRLSRNPVSFSLIIGVPLLAAALFLSPLLLFPDLPQWLIIVTIIAMMISAIAGLKYIMRQWGSVDALIHMEEQGFNITLSQHSVFYPRKEYAGPWSGIENLSSYHDPRYHRNIYLLRLRQPSVTLSLMPEEPVSVGDDTPFGAALKEFVNRHNMATIPDAGSHIGQRGIFESIWAKALTLLTWILIAAAIAGRWLAPDRIGSPQVLQAICFGGLWLSLYYINSRRKA